MKKNKFWQKIFRWFIFAVLSGFVLLIYSYLETYWLKVNTVVVESVDIPPAFDGKKIVFVSDVHHGKYLSINRVKRLVKLINKQNPDIILLGGDYSYTNKDYIRPFFEEFTNTHSRYGKFAVLGNHDYFVDPDLTRKMINETKIYSCDNISYWLKLNGDSIKIGGVGELENEKQLLNNTIKDVKKEDFCILMCHQPMYFAYLKTDLIDLTFSGHTHGGQVTFFGKWAPVLPTSNGIFSHPRALDQRYRYGLVKDESRQSYISSGVGTRFPPFRFFCRPEIAVIILKKIDRIK
jgi:uncharacterized protein